MNMVKNIEQTVYIVDDDDAVRKALELLVKSEGLQALGFSNALMFLESAENLQPGCLLLDICMPGMNGLELQKLLQERKTDIPVIVLTGHADVPAAVTAMKCGAFDFIEKPFDAHALLAQIRHCLDLEKSQRDKERLRKRACRSLASLTPREKQVMEGLVDGKRNKQIANELFISFRTVELHRANIMNKLHANTLSDIVRTAILADNL